MEHGGGGRPVSSMACRPQPGAKRLQALCPCRGGPSPGFLLARSGLSFPRPSLGPPQASSWGHSPTRVLHWRAALPFNEASGLECSRRRSTLGPTDTSPARMGPGPVLSVLTPGTLAAVFPRVALGVGLVWGGC